MFKNIISRKYFIIHLIYNICCCVKFILIKTKNANVTNLFINKFTHPNGLILTNTFNDTKDKVYDNAFKITLIYFCNMFSIHTYLIFL